MFDVLFAQGILSVISKGASEDVSEIISLCKSEKIVDYLCDKYKSLYLNLLPEHKDLLNEYFLRTVQVFDESDVESKFLIYGTNSGLLFLVSLLFEY